jgi:hypothetical protein
MMFQSSRLLAFTGCLIAFVAVGVASADALHVNGRHMMQGGAGGAGGKGGNGAIPGVGGSGGLGGNPNGLDGADGANGQPNGPFTVMLPPVAAPTAAPTAAPVAAPTKATLLNAPLAPVLVQSITDAMATKTCATPTVFTSKGITNSVGKGNVRVTLLLPNANPPPLAALNVTNYSPDTIQLAGIKANTRTSVVIIDKIEKLAVSFDDTNGTLAKLNGTTAYVTGIVNFSAGPSYKYFATIPVCKA